MSVSRLLLDRDAHHHRVRVQYVDTDQAGVVHHAAYLRYLEAARIELLRARGIDYRQFEIEVGKGDFWRTPGNVEHTFRAGPEGALILDIFSPPRAEYRKPGSGFGV